MKGELTPVSPPLVYLKRPEPRSFGLVEEVLEAYEY